MLQFSSSRADFTLPTEILYLILEQVILENNVPSLKAMSTVSKVFHPLCRKHLFHHVTLTIATDHHYSQNGRHAVDAFLEFASFLSSNSEILQSIRSLVLLDVSAMSCWTFSNPPESDGEPMPQWSIVSAPLICVLNGIGNLHSLEIRSQLELDWTSFDTGIKRAISTLLAQSASADPAVRVASVRGIGDDDLLALVSPCSNIAFAQVRFSLGGKRLPAATPGPVRVGPLPGSVAATVPALWRLTLGREMGVDALSWLAHHPASLAGVRHLTMESLSAAVPVRDLWVFIQGMRDSLEHLEWWFEDLGFREPADAIALQQIDLSIFSRLRSLAIRSSQTGLLINLMVILEATGPTNTIEEITIIMPTIIDKFITFRASAVWKRIDSAFASSRFQKHLHTVKLSFVYTHQPLMEQTVTALFAAFTRNLPSLRGKDLTVDQRRLHSF